LVVLALSGCGRRGKGAISRQCASWNRRGAPPHCAELALDVYRPPRLSPPLIAAQPSRRVRRVLRGNDGSCRWRVTLPAPGECVGLNPGGQHGSSVTFSQFTPAAAAPTEGTADAA